MTPRDVAVVGGGLSGLTAALALREGSGGAVRVTVYEARENAGGNASTLLDDGYLIERGPNGFLENDASRTVMSWLDLETRLIEANAAARRRFIVRGGRLRAVPDSPIGLLCGDALSLAGRLRVLGEPWVRSRSPKQETVSDFARRRLGSEAARVLVDAAVGGITAGDSRELEVESAFPTLVEMEREHGSLLKAMMHRARAARAGGAQAGAARAGGARAGGAHAGRPRLVSFPGGMAELMRAFEKRLGPSLELGAPIRSLSRADGRWRLAGQSGATAEADAVVIATPARGAATMLRALDPELSDLLAGVRFGGVAVVALAFRASDLRRPLDGYGFLVPSAERGRTLGAVWESSLFADRAPREHVLIRAMIGGAREPAALFESDEALVARAREDLARFMGLEAEPGRRWVSRAPEAIAQYARGHAGRIAAIREASARHPGLALCGTSYDGVSMGAAMAAGCRAAGVLMESSEPARRSA